MIKIQHRGTATEMGVPCFDVGTGSLFANSFLHFGADAPKAYKGWLNMLLFDRKINRGPEANALVDDMHAAIMSVGKIVLLTDTPALESCHAHYIAELLVGRVVGNIGGRKTPLGTMAPIAAGVLASLEPYCERSAIGGSIRRAAPQCGDIEIVCIPKRETHTVVRKKAIVSGPDLFNPTPVVIRPAETEQVEMPVPGFMETVEAMCRVKGQASGKYTQRLIWSAATGPVKVDIFMCRPENWGLIMAIRTGSAEFSRQLAVRWANRGYRSEDGMLYDREGKARHLHEEADLFELLGIDWVAPEFRDLEAYAQ